MDNERTAVITIGDEEYTPLLTTKATKEIAGRYGGLENLGEKLMKSENFEMAIGEIVWLITLLANQSILIHNLKDKEHPKELLTEDVVYGRRGKCIYNETTALWSNVPRGILTRYVTSPALREEMKQYKALHTLWCGGDLAPARVYRLARYYAAQYKNFAHYYFDKSKEK